MKRIAIFCDGTWNTPDKTEEGKYCQTNVVKMANALSSASTDGAAQLLYYDTGIGSEGNRIKRIFDGATGFGISENILEAYRFVINNFERGDELFLFGFSRGAFTVRSLAGLIRNSGILKTGNINLVEKAYSIYRSRNPRYQPREVEATLFRKTYAIENITRIKFIGVWDTVGALGNPLPIKGFGNKRIQFHDTELSSIVDNAFHALAIDEKRKNFEATLWLQQAHSTGQVLEQMWFPGVHSDVGGGFPEDETGLSDIALQWMLEKAQSCNLNFNKITLNIDPMAEMHESYKSFYKLQSRHFRPIGLPAANNCVTNEFIHPAAAERYKNNASYKPKNLVDFYNNQL